MVKTASKPRDRRAYQRAYYARTRAVRQAKMRANYQKHREARLAKAKAYYWSHREACRARSREYQRTKWNLMRRLARRLGPPLTREQSYVTRTILDGLGKVSRTHRAQGMQEHCLTVMV